MDRLIVYIPIILCLLFMPVPGIFSQGYLVSGKILDAESGKPVEAATVYINGTSKGTTTGREGGFTLPGVTLPSELIISHVSYQLKRISLQDANSLEKLQISLDLKIVILEEATVIHDLLRKDYIRRFERWFLGADYEKYGADILNDSVLIFSVFENDQFSVAANEPIIVDLPVTGYTLKADLINFDLRYKDDLDGYHCSILGYYFFNPKSPGSGRNQRAIARKRTELYYNSSMHFCKSLYHNKLLENGYLFRQNCHPSDAVEDENDFMHDMKASYTLDPYGNRQLVLTDFTCREYRITFYYNTWNRPVDLTYLGSNPNRIEWSGLRFLRDSIRIYPSGRIPENSILYSNSIGRKAIAAMLPEDYIPSMQ